MSLDLFQFEKRARSAEYTRRWRSKNREKSNAIARNWRKANPEKVNKARRAYYARKKEKLREEIYNAKLQRKYKISREEYDKILREQGGVCAICGNSPVPNKKLGVDHDHITGSHRGLLCDKCNRAIGLLGDEPQKVLSAFLYLEHHKNANG